MCGGVHTSASFLGIPPVHKNSLHSVTVRLTVTMGITSDLSNFQRGMIIGAKACRFQYLRNGWPPGLFTQECLGFPENCANSAAVLWAKTAR
jgi:hypothetical protein